MTELDWHDRNATLLGKLSTSEDFLLVVSDIEQCGSKFNRIVITIVRAIICENRVTTGMIFSELVAAGILNYL